MKKVVIIGAGGFGREVAWIIERINKVSPTWDLVGFLDDDSSLLNKPVYKDYNVIGGIDYSNSLDEVYFVCAVGNAKIRKAIVDKVGNKNFATIIDPSAIISDTSKIGGGSIICQNVIVSINVDIGKHCDLIYGSIVGHDSKIDSFVTLYPSVNISGNVNVGACVEIGTGAKVIQQKNIGNNVIIGAGSVVIKDIPNDCTAVGVPTKLIKMY